MGSVAERLTLSITDFLSALYGHRFLFSRKIKRNGRKYISIILPLLQMVLSPHRAHGDCWKQRENKGLCRISRLRKLNASPPDPLCTTPIPIMLQNDDMAFGWPSSYWQLSLANVPGGVSAFDQAVEQASAEYRRRAVIPPFQCREYPKYAIIVAAQPLL